MKLATPAGLLCVARHGALALLLCAPLPALAQDCLPIADAEFCRADTVWAEGESRAVVGQAAEVALPRLLLRISAGAPRQEPVSTDISVLNQLEEMARSQGAEITSHWEAGDDAFGWPTMALRSTDSDVVAMMSLYPAPSRDYIVTTLANGSIPNRLQLAAHREALNALSIPDAAADDLAPPSTPYALDPGFGEVTCLPIGGHWVCPEDSTIWSQLDVAESEGMVLISNRSFSADFRARDASALAEADRGLDGFASALAGNGAEILARFAADDPAYSVETLEFRAAGAASRQAGLVSVVSLDEWLYLVSTTLLGRSEITPEDRAAHREAIAMVRSAR